MELGSFESTTTAFAAVVALRLLLIPMLPKRSSACFRSDSCSVRRSRSLLAASSSSLLSSSLSSASLRAFSACFSAMRWALDFLFAFSSASALAFRSAATLAFSRSTSESSAASARLSSGQLNVAQKNPSLCIVSCNVDPTTEPHVLSSYCRALESQYKGRRIAPEQS